MARSSETLEKLEREVEIINKLGFHARAAANFVKIAEKFKSEIIVKKDDVEANGKSILGLLTLGAPKGSKITLVIYGPDASEAMDALIELINNKFGEEE